MEKVKVPSKGLARRALDRMLGRTMYRHWVEAHRDPQPAWDDLHVHAQRAWIALAKQYTHDSVLGED